MWLLCFIRCWNYIWHCSLTKVVHAILLDSVYPFWTVNFSLFQLWLSHSLLPSLILTLCLFPGDREFIFLDEQLTKLILELDKVQTDGLEEIRVARKSAVQRIQYLIDALESKVWTAVEESSTDCFSTVPELL